MASVVTAPDGPSAGVNYVAETELKAGALGFWGGLIQAVTHIAPGLNILLGLTFIVSFAGIGAPIAYIVGGIICLGVAVVLTQLDGAANKIHQLRRGHLALLRECRKREQDRQCQRTQRRSQPLHNFYFDASLPFLVFFASLSKRAPL